MTELRDAVRCECGHFPSLGVHAFNIDTHKWGRCCICREGHCGGYRALAAAPADGYRAALDEIALTDMEPGDAKNLAYEALYGGPR